MKTAYSTVYLPEDFKERILKKHEELRENGENIAIWQVIERAFNQAYGENYAVLKD